MKIELLNKREGSTIIIAEKINKRGIIVSNKLGL